MKLLATAACLLLAATTANAAVAISSIKNKSSPEVDGLLSARDNGDIWFPPSRGTNQLTCGTFGNDKTVATRLVVDVQDTVEIELFLGNDHGGGVLFFDVTYGNQPNMLLNPGFKVSEQIVDASERTFSVAFPMSSLKFSNPATMQITFEANGEDVTTAHQCIDLDVKGGPDGGSPMTPYGFGDPDFKDIPSPYQSGKTLSTVPAAEGLETIHYILFIVVAMLLMCFIMTWIKYKSPNDEATAQPQFAPQLAMTENIQHPAEPEEIVRAAPPQREADSDPEPVQLDPPAQHSAPPQESADEIKSDDNGEAGDGSKGRHFHFRYVE